MPGEIFDITELPTTALTRAAVKAARPLLRKAVGLSEVERLYRALPSVSADGFASSALGALGVSTDCSAIDLSRIPATGPLVVVANHPHGALDGLALAALVRRVRTDVRLLANHWLAALPELAATCFFVDPFGGRGAAERSRSGLRAAHLWLRRGGALIAFPAGEVAHRLGPGLTPTDAPWLPTVGRLAASTGAALLPARIEGRNSGAFYCAGWLHPALRTMLLGRELLAKRDSRVVIRIGPAIPPPAGTLPTDGGTGFLNSARESMESLGGPDGQEEMRLEAVASEVESLPAHACLVEAGNFKVYCCAASDIPLTLHEIGRLREVTYRAVGEGTGRDYDLDDFDQRYLHLFAWDTSARCVVGAYRIGRTDVIVRRGGLEGLYTRTLFKYDRAFIERLGPALELGRSFVCERYQRHHSALLLLWKGISRLVALNPSYRVLFGPVSISARYSDASHALLMAFLEQNHLAAGVADLVVSTNPPAVTPSPKGVREVVPKSAEEASQMVAALEPDGKAMPVLLRQYLRLNARLLAFNVDPDFGNALDALMMVDLMSVDRTILNRYFGKQEADAFLAHHARPASAQAA